MNALYMALPRMLQGHPGQGLLITVISLFLKLALPGKPQARMRRFQGLPCLVINTGISTEQHPQTPQLASETLLPFIHLWPVGVFCI